MIELRETCTCKVQQEESGASYLKLTLFPILSGNWQRSKLIGVEVSDPAISRDSPALQSSTLFAIVIMMMITIIVVIVILLTTVCT